MKKEMLSNEKSENYWYINPIALLQSTRLVPTPDLTKQERVNAFARLIILVTLILFLFGFGNWWLFLIFGLGLSILFGIIESQQPSTDLVEYYQCPAKPSPVDTTPKIRIRHPSAYSPRYPVRYR